MRSILLLLLSVHPAALPAQQIAFPVPPAPAIAAKSYLLLDFHSGQPLAAHEPQARVEPASLTKLMTAYLTFAALKQKRIRLDQAVPVSERAWRAEGSRMFIEPRKPVTVEELIRGMIVQSGNDACIALAEVIAGSEEAFADLMNQEAKRMGLANTRFVNSTGLPHPQHHSTAQDLAALAAALIRDFPEHYPLYSQKEYRYNNITQPNRNRLLWMDPSVDGVKTGHTEGAGYCLIASSSRGGRRLLSVLLGSTSEATRAQESLKLLNWGYQFFDSVKLYTANDAVRALEVWKGAARNVKVGVGSDLFVTVPKGEADKLKAELVSQQPLVAPLSKGQRIGVLRVTHDGKAFGEYPLVTLEPVAAAGFFGRSWDTLRLWLK